MQKLMPMCFLCKHFRIKNYSCKAFPGGVPRIILFEYEDHTKPYENDNGITFEPADINSLETVIDIYKEIYPDADWDSYFED